MSMQLGLQLFSARNAFVENRSEFYENRSRHDGHLQPHSSGRSVYGCSIYHCRTRCHNAQRIGKYRYELQCVVCVNEQVKER
jgi:hypothetical protein